MLLLLWLWPIFGKRGFVFTSILFHFYLGYPSDVFICILHLWNWTWFLLQQLLLQRGNLWFPLSFLRGSDMDSQPWSELKCKSLDGTQIMNMNRVLHLFAAHPPSFCQISQLFHELFQNCKKRLGAFFPDSDFDLWIGRSIYLFLFSHLRHLTLLCMCSRAEWVSDQQWWLLSFVCGPTNRLWLPVPPWLSAPGQKDLWR